MVLAHEQPLLRNGLQAEIRVGEVFVDGKKDLAAAGIRLRQAPCSGQGICPCRERILRGSLVLEQQLPCQLAQLLSLPGTVVFCFHPGKGKGQFPQQLLVAARLPQGADIKNFVHRFRQGGVLAGAQQGGLVLVRIQLQKLLHLLEQNGKLCKRSCPAGRRKHRKGLKPLEFFFEDLNGSFHAWLCHCIGQH